MTTIIPRQWLSSRTMWFALALEVFGAIQLGLPDLAAQIPPHLYPYIFIGCGIAVRVLRMLTTQPLAEK